MKSVWIAIGRINQLPSANDLIGLRRKYRFQDDNQEEYSTLVIIITIIIIEHAELHILLQDV